MTIPTTPLKLPIQGKPLDEEGNWTPTWARTLQLLFNRVGSFTAPSNLQLAGAIGAFVAGPAAAVDSNIVVFDGITGKLVKDGGTKVAALATLASPTFTGIPLAPTAAAGTSTTQIATTAYVGAAISGNVAGPVSSASGDIALFNGTTGKLIADSGVQLSALAPLASPALTGTPIAPTAAVGANTTQLATTAFVQAAFGTASSFSAHNNGTVQSIPNAAFTKLTFSTAVFNNGANLTTSTWTPPARLVLLEGATALSPAASSLVTVAIYKNGVEYKRGVMHSLPGAGTVVATVSCIDVSSGTDTYEIWAYQNSGASMNTIGASSLTYFQGTTITP